MTSKCRTEDMAERVKSVRFTLGLSQVALADRLQVAFSTVNRWERGKTRPLPALLRQLKALEMEDTASKKGKKRSGGKRR
jgi:transcriptional regulator with XRE-family HTH domain